MFITFKQEFQLEENEERSMIEPKSMENSKFKELIKVLIDWVNDELHHYRIIVQDIEEDLYDGQVGMLKFELQLLLVLIECLNAIKKSLGYPLYPAPKSKTLLEGKS